MGVGTAVREMWDRVTGVQAEQEAEGARKTVAGSLVDQSSLRAGGVGVNTLPKPTTATCGGLRNRRRRGAR